MNKHSEKFNICACVTAVKPRRVEVSVCAFTFYTHASVLLVVLSALKSLRC